MARKLVWIAWLLACSAPATGQWTSGGCPGGVCPVQSVPQPTAPSPRELLSVVRIANRQGNSQSLGSGTLVDKNSEHGLVLTCGHLFDDGIGTVLVQFANGKSYGAKVLEVDRAWDLAALLICTPDARPLAVAKAPPRIGTSLDSCGFGPDGRLWRNRGKMLRPVTTQGTTTPESFELTGIARQGDSGGPVLDDQFRLVGVLFGTNGQVVAATGCGPIRRFLARHSQHFRAIPEQPTNNEPAKQVERPQTPAVDAKSPERLTLIERALAGLEDRLATAQASWRETHAALAAQHQSLDAWRERAGRLESRLETLAEIADADKLRAIVHEVVQHDALPVAGNAGAAGIWAAIWPLVAGALGLSTPPTAAFVAWKLLRWRIARRRGKSRMSISRTGEVNTRGNLLNDDYGRQLVEVFGQSGRSPIQDATLGREYDEELRRAEASSDGALARFARSLRERVQTRFHRIHDFNPSPAEPIEPTSMK